jgi:hypothetical protein
MLEYRLVEETSQKVIYEYYPEGETEGGIVSFDKESKTNSIVKLSATDEHQIYAQKLFRRIREFANNNFFKREGIIAWY